MEANFNFNLPEEESEYKIFVHANNYYCLIVDMINLFKQKLDHDVDTGRYTEEQVTALRHFENEFYEDLADRGISTHFQ